MEENLIVNSTTLESVGTITDVDDVHEGQLYKTQADFKRALKAYTMKRGFEYAPTKCNDLKLTTRCRVADCPWRIKAHYLPGLTQWWVKKFISKHTYSRAIGDLSHRNCDEEFIAYFVMEQVVANEKYMPKMVQTKILRQHDVRISYWNAYRARERILQKIREDFEGSFAAFLSYMRELRMGTFLMDKFRGTLLTVLCIDENNYFLPLVWTVVDAHGYCIYHLSTNPPHATKNTPAWRRFWAATHAYTVAEFNEIIEKMNDLNPEQYKCVVKLPQHRGGYPLVPSKALFNAHFQLCQDDKQCYTTFKGHSNYIPSRGNTKENGVAITPTSMEVVDLSKMTCFCKRWDIDGIPYKHAIGAISCRLRDPYDFIDDWFKTTTYHVTYNDYVPPTRGKEHWPPIPNTVVPPRPPNVRIQSGRRKIARK
ncbi:uncharacterized protein LOC109712098 [Ananas comosus]|uniref:Uncharacterized protein LOC109712098 n=1 Tax=Ananas comosus TaxID=4615 RepID=A0A6P5F663_ANACO|nr:uncharacterized protein LOC109712098 [Ananas comosus]